MKEIFKKAKQNSLLGRRCKRLLKMKGFAMVMLLFVGILYASSAFGSDNTVSKISGAGMAIAMGFPIAFAVPKELNLTDSDAKGLEALAKHISEQVDQYQKGMLDSDDLNNKVRNAFEEYAKEYGINKDTFSKMEDALKTQGLEIKKLKEGHPSETKPLKEQLKGLFSKENIDEVKGKRAAHMVGIEVKAATSITTSNATNAPHALRYEVLPGIQSAPEEETVVFPTLYKGQTGARTLIWINRVNKDGGAAFIAEGALKPLMDWEYKEESNVAKKIAVSTKVSTEMLYDFEYMESEIRSMLDNDLFDKIDERLLNGSGGDEPTGIITNASGYITTELDGKVSMANNADAIRAAMLQMRLLRFRPNVVFMNPSDAAVIDLTKSTTGNYISIELYGILRKLRVIETTQIDSGSFLLMDTNKWQVRMLENFRLEFGWENDDFRRNMITVIAEARLHSYQYSVDAGSVLYESFATIKTAIEKA